MSSSLPTGGVLGGPMGVATGVLGPLSVVLDPPFEPAPTPVLAGGTIGRPLSRAGPGRWLLELDLGGQRWRIADRACTPVSRARNGEVLFAAGLSDLAFAVDSESVSVSVRAGAADTWARQRRVLGPLRGRRFLLRYWYEGQILEDAFVALQGVVESAAFGSPDDPASLALGLERNLPALSREMISPTAFVSPSTWSGVFVEDASGGSLYPLVIGCPGAARGSGDVTPATPGLLVNRTLFDRLVVAGHRVAATEVTVFDLTAHTVEALPIEHLEDDLGQEVATVLLSGSGTAVDQEHEYAVGWSRETGGGILHRGRPVTGLGDLLAWGADTLCSAVHDAGEMEARRQALNRFRIDTCVNESILWADWLESNVLDLFGLEETQGRHGVYYQERRYTTDRRLVRGRLVTGTAGGGYRVERVAPVADTDEEVQNAITLKYLPFAASLEQFVERHTIDPTPRTGATVEDLRSRDPRCDYSERLFQRREATYETAMTSDRATAIAIVSGKAARHALPKQATVYQGGRDLLDFRKYDVVSVSDASPGAYFVDDLAIVVGVTLVDASTVQLAVEIDSDPVRSPTVRSA